MVPVEALKLALNKETGSIELYKKLCDEHSDNDELKDLFSFLVNEEEKHKKMIEQKIFDMTKG